MNYFATFKKKLKKLDALGEKIELQLEGQKVHKTYFGSLLTILIALTVAAAFFMIGSELIQKKNPNIIVSESNESEIAHSEFKISNNFFFGFAIFDENEHKIVPFNQNKFKLLSYALTRQNGKNLEILEIPTNLQPCSEELNSETIPQNTMYYEISEFLCLETSMIDLEFFGNFLTQDSSRFSLIFESEEQKEENDGEDEPIISTPTSSSSSKIIENSTNNYSLLLIVQSSYEDAISSEHPFSNFVQIEKFPISDNANKNEKNNIVLDFQKSIFNTDNGLIMEQFATQTNIKFDRFYSNNEFDLNLPEVNKNQFFRVTFQSSRVVQKYQRKYMKLQNLLAICGGMLKVLLLLARFISKPFTKLSMHTSLVNRLFFFEDQRIKEGDHLDEEYQNDNSHNSDAQQCSIHQINTESPNSQIQHPQHSTVRKSIEMENLDKLHHQFEAGDSSELYQNNSHLNSERENMIQSRPKLNHDNLPNFNNQFNHNNKNNNNNHNNHNNININDNEYNQDIKMEEQIQQRLTNQLQTFEISRGNSEKLSHSDLGEFRKKACSVASNGSQSPIMSKSINSKSKFYHQRKSLVIGNILKRYSIDKSIKKNDEHLKEAKHITQSKEENPHQIFKRLFQPFSEISMGIKDYFKYFLKGCFSNYQKRKQIHFGMKKVSEKLNIIFIIKKLIEIDKMKMLFLTEQQIQLFEYLPRPVVNLDPENMNMEFQTENNNKMHDKWLKSQLFMDQPYIEKVLEAKRSYEKIKQKQKKNVIDLRLLDLLDDQRKEFFDLEIETELQVVQDKSQYVDEFGRNIGTQFDTNIEMESPFPMTVSHHTAPHQTVYNAHHPHSIIPTLIHQNHNHHSSHPPHQNHIHSNHQNSHNQVLQKIDPCDSIFINMQNNKLNSINPSQRNIYKDSCAHNYRNSIVFSNMADFIKEQKEISSVEKIQHHQKSEEESVPSSLAMNQSMHSPQKLKREFSFNEQIDFQNDDENHQDDSSPPNKNVISQKIQQPLNTRVENHDQNFQQHINLKNCHDYDQNAQSQGDDIPNQFQKSIFDCYNSQMNY